MNFTFNQLTLYTAADHFDQQISFFKNWGYALLEKSKDSFAFQAGNTRIDFKLSPTTPILYHYAFLIPQGASDAALVWLLKNKIQPYRHSQGEFIKYWDFWSAKSIYFYDAAGNVLEFIEHENLVTPKFEHEIFVPARDIIQIAEMGIPTDDVVRDYTIMKSTFNLDLNKGKQDRFCDFGVYGTMFIIISTKHYTKWYGSNVDLQTSNFEAVLLLNEKKYHLHFNNKTISINEN